MPDRCIGKLMRTSAGYQFLQRDYIAADKRCSLVIPGQELFAIIDAPGFCARKWIVTLPKGRFQNQRKTTFNLGELTPAAWVIAPRIMNTDGGSALMGEALVVCELGNAPRRRRKFEYRRQLGMMLRYQSHLGIAAGK